MGKRILCIDTELTCWNDREYQKSQILEIIQFGMAEIDVDTLTIARHGSYYVTNTRHDVSPFCYHLTGISQHTLNKRGKSLEHVAELLKRKWGVGQSFNALLAWGDERACMEPDFTAKQVAYPFHNGLMDLANYYRFNFCADKSVRISLKQAAEHYGVELVEPQHNAEADALSLAHVVLAMIRQGDLFPALKPQE